MTTPNVRTLRLRFTLRLNGPLSHDGVIQKLGRWRIQDANPANFAYWKSRNIDPNDIDAGALVIQNSHLMFNGGQFSAPSYNIISLLPDGDAAYGPDTFIDRVRTIDATLKLAPTMQWFSFWFQRWPWY